MSKSVEKQPKQPKPTPAPTSPLFDLSGMVELETVAREKATEPAVNFHKAQMLVNNYIKAQMLEHAWDSFKVAKLPGKDVIILTPYKGDKPKKSPSQSIAMKTYYAELGIRVLTDKSVSGKASEVQHNGQTHYVIEIPSSIMTKNQGE